MTSATWNSLRMLQSAQGDRPWQTVAGKVDGLLSASLETVADVLSTATVQTLREGISAAGQAFRSLAPDLDVEQTQAFAAGRLSAISDVLGYAARQTGDDAILKKAARQPYATVLSQLHARPMRNADLCEALGRDKGQVSRLLSELRAVDAVTSHKQGRDVFNALTPIGRLVVDKGVEDQAKVPLAHTRVHELAAERSYDLDSFKKPDVVRDRSKPAILQGTKAAA